MVLSTQRGGTNYYRLHIDKADMEKFNRSQGSVFVKLEENDYTEITLTSTFWTTCPELRGKKINEWIKETGLHRWKKGYPNKLNLKRINDSKFKISRITR